MLTFTVPSELRMLAYREQHWFYDLMFEAVSGVLRDFALDPHHLGGAPGFTAVLHTWTRQMQHHPHLHVIMPGVALSEDGLRIKRAKHRKYLFPVKALGAAFRNRMNRLIKERDAKEQTKCFAQIERPVWQKPWVVDVQGVGKGQTALRYLARYVNKTAISEQRLLGYDEEGRIRLNCQDSESGHWRVITLSVDEFLRRWCLHVLPKGLMRIRHYGFLSAAARRKYERIHEILQSRPLPKPKRLEPEKPKCPCCGKDMVLLRVIERWPKRTFLSRAPPQGTLSKS
ncbi:IS91 family transposase [soil metagenome]